VGASPAGESVTVLLLAPPRLGAAPRSLAMVSVVLPAHTAL
jgi:hypothetical protein